MSTLDEEDRREYYRIEDTIALEIRPLSALKPQARKCCRMLPRSFNLLSELHLSEFESQHLLRQISERDRNLAAFLKSQNKRIDLLSQVIAITVLGQIGEPQPVIIPKAVSTSSTRPPSPPTRADQAGADAPGPGPVAARTRHHCDRKGEGFDVGTNSNT